ncbi:MAG: right-handed parallel beta-helix repeat-containing protein, partial [Mycobacterium sp.]|nr:right-handed parallel beta-helix repeat-containing protein [Mycobacterium sp.]
MPLSFAEKSPDEVRELAYPGQGVPTLAEDSNGRNSSGFVLGRFITRWRRFVAVPAALALVLGLAWSMPQTAHAQGTLWVNNAAGVTPTPPGTSCTNPGYTTIQAAVNAAASGDTIRVCSGTYDRFNLTGALNNLTIIGSSPTAGDCTTSPSDTIIQGPNPTVSNGLAALRGNGITLEGFVIQGNTNNGPGVSTYRGVQNWNGYTIQNNLVQNNVYGLLFGAAAGPATSIATHNCFISNNQPGSASGTGIYVSNPVTGGVDFGLFNGTISDNRFQNHNNVSILIDGGNANNTVTGNTATTGANGIGIYQSTGGQISNNTVSDMGGAGIFLCGTLDLLVDHNTVTGRNPGGSRGIQAFGVGTCTNIGAPLPTPTPNMNLTVQDNTVVQNGDSGFRADGNAIFNSTISGNQFTRNFIGIRVTGAPNTGNTFANNQIGDNNDDGIRFFASDNTIQNNVVTSNGRDGVSLQVGGQNFTTDNQVIGNRASNNARWDCLDQSTGAGTAGTANTWTGNFGSTAVPSSVGDVGICPFVTTDAMPTVTLPGTLSDTATVTMVVTPIPGTVTFSVYGPSATPVCNGTDLVETFAPVAPDPTTGVAHSPAFTPTQEGTYYWIANYQGGPGSQASSA